MDSPEVMPGAVTGRLPRPVRPADGWFNGWLSPLHGVRWTVAYAGLLLYTVIITTYTFQGFGWVVMAVALLTLLMEPKARLNGMLALFGMLLVWAYVTHFGGIDPAVSRDALTNFGKVWLIALVAGITLKDRPRIRLFMIVFLAAFALYPARGAIVNYFIGGYTVFGRALWNYIYRNPNDLAGLALLQLSMAAALVVGERKSIIKLGAIAAVVVLPLLMMLTQSRGAFVGLMFFAGAAFTEQRRKARFVLVGMIVLLGAWLILPSTAWDRFSMVSTIGRGGSQVLEELDDQGSAAQRYDIWRAARRIIAERPLQGVGWGNYPQANAAVAPHLGARDTHSTYLNLAAEVGILGLLLFLGLVGAVVYRAEKSRRRIKPHDPVAAQQIRFLEFGLIGFLLAGVFATYPKLTFLYLHMALLWMMCTVASAPAVGHRPRLRRRDA